MIDSAVLFNFRFRGGVLCLLPVSPYIAAIQDVVGSSRLDFFLPSTSLVVSCTISLVLSVEYWLE